jgi:hypothetical protein
MLSIADYMIFCIIGGLLFLGLLAISTSLNKVAGAITETKQPVRSCKLGTGVDQTRQETQHGE